jgi:hypothetical protein
MTWQAVEGNLGDCFEYYGGTTIEHVRTQSGKTVWRDWILFDTVEEAIDFYCVARGNALQTTNESWTEEPCGE